MFQLLHPLVRVLQPFLVPLCFILAWTFAVLALWSVWAAMRDSITTGKRLHQIPCPNCQFFTGDYHLKCTVHPSTALTEEAIDCPDYCPQTRELYH